MSDWVRVNPATFVNAATGSLIFFLTNGDGSDPASESWKLTFYAPNGLKYEFDISGDQGEAFRAKLGDSCLWDLDTFGIPFPGEANMKHWDSERR